MPNKSSKPALLIFMMTCAALACGSVNPPPQPPVGMGGAPNGGAPNATCEGACDNLARLGCPEDLADCVAQCTRILSDDRFTIDLACRVNARSQDDARACGPASCQP